MSYLILDTDKQTTHSLRLLLSSISTVPVWDAANLDTFKGLSKKHPVPAEIIFLDLEGDPEKVMAFEEHIMLGRSPSSALILLGSRSRSSSILKADSYLQKPIHIANLQDALIDAQAKTQELRSSVTFYGARTPSELIREVGRAERLWKQIIEIQSLPELVSDRRELTRIGAIFLAPKSITDADVQAIGQLKKITSASRISLICTSKKAEEIGKLRNFCDYYLPEKTDWRKLLDQLALTRLMRLASSLNVDKAKAYLKNGDVKRARKILKETIKIAPLKVEALLLLGECDYLVDDFENAREKYQEALNLNPCLPKPYARLLEIEKGTAREEVLKNAIDYCPGVSEFRV